MKIERLNPDTLAQPLAAYSQVVRAGSLVTTAGLIALDSDGKIVGEGDVQAQVRKTLENMVAALDAVGATLDDVIKTTLYLADMGDYAEMNAVYNEFFELRGPRERRCRPLWCCLRYCSRWTQSRWWRSRRGRQAALAWSRVKRSCAYGGGQRSFFVNTASSVSPRQYARFNSAIVSHS